MLLLLTKNLFAVEDAGQSKELDVRNLKDSMQPDYLVYTEFNLPVNSKRKLKDNVNMIDHIRDQNIVGDFERTAPVRRVESEEAMKSALLRRNMAEMKTMAEAEEKAAVEELRQVTDLESPMEGGEEGEFVGRAPSVGGEPRQVKLQRTCQNQNFDIFQAKYPEMKQDTQKSNTSINNNNNSNSAKAIHFNNLFRESPDFTLATCGNYSPNPKTQITYRSPEPKPEPEPELEEAKMSVNPVPNGENTAHLNREHCKVFDLDQEFQYLGSLSGHSYFVEKSSEE